MSRFDLTEHDQYRVEQAREALAAAKQYDMADVRAMAHLIGRLEVVLSQLLDMLDEDGAS